jgi:hypothetical protein
MSMRYIPHRYLSSRHKLTNAEAEAAAERRYRFATRVASYHAEAEAAAYAEASRVTYLYDIATRAGTYTAAAEVEAAAYAEAYRATYLYEIATRAGAYAKAAEVEVEVEAKAEDAYKAYVAAKANRRNYNQ